LKDRDWMAGLTEASREEEALLRELEATPLDPARAEAMLDVATARSLRELEKGARKARPPVRRALWALGALSAAVPLAAGFALFLGTRSAPLPSYEAALLAGGEIAERGPADPTHPTRVGRGTELDLVLRPDTRVHGAVSGRAFLRVGGELRSWSATYEVQDSGAVRVHGSFTEPLGEAGDAELVVMIGRPSALPADDTEARAVLAKGNVADRVVVRVPLAPSRP
jgi:hypothetical protein